MDEKITKLATVINEMILSQVNQIEKRMLELNDSIDKVAATADAKDKDLVKHINRIYSELGTMKSAIDMLISAISKAGEALKNDKS